MIKLFNIIVLAVSLVGCGKTYCADLAEQICKNCDVGDEKRDVECACLIDGEVRNGSKYFKTRKLAEIRCYEIQNSVKDEYVGPDGVAECRGDLEVFEKYDSDACELNGYDAPSGGYGGSGTDADADSFCEVRGETCEAFASHYLQCEGADYDYAESLLDYDDSGCAAVYYSWVDSGCC